MEKDYYKILGVAETADAKEIKEAYRTMAFKYHPDRNQETPQAADMMKAINEAYAVLSNPSKRQEYDMMRRQFGDSAYHQFRTTHSDQDIFSGSDIHQIFEEVAKTFGLRGFDDIFKEFYGNSKGYQSFNIKGPGFFGGGFVFFGGLGILDKLSKLLFKSIGIELPQNGADIADTIYLNQNIAQQGGPYAYLNKKTSKKLMVKIPAGIRDGQRIRLSGMGEDGKGSGQPGDLYLTVKINKPLLGKIFDFIAELRK